MYCVIVTPQRIDNVNIQLMTETFEMPQVCIDYKNQQKIEKYTKHTIKKWMQIAWLSKLKCRRVEMSTECQEVHFSCDCLWDCYENMEGELDFLFEFIEQIFSRRGSSCLTTSWIKASK